VVVGRSILGMTSSNRKKMVWSMSSIPKRNISLDASLSKTLLAN
jgi:hypothetical protein